MKQDLLIPIQGANWKHYFLNKLARSREFAMRLRIFNISKKLLNINLIKANTNSGVELLLDISDWVQYQIYFYGNYEQKSVNLFKKLSLQSEVILDVGSHIGQYALEAAKLDQTKSKRIFAIEANPKIFAQLLNNIQINQFHQIKPILGAVSDKHSLTEIYIPDNGNLGNTQIGVSKTAENIDSYFISTYKLQTLMAQQNLDKIDLMKIDIEGHEFIFFENLFIDKIFPSKIIFEYIPAIFPQIKDCVILFEKNNYKIFTINEEAFRNEEKVPEQNLLAILQN
jgi:FkbM family methyltransferase